MDPDVVNYLHLCEVIKKSEQNFKNLLFSEIPQTDLTVGSNSVTSTNPRLQGSVSSTTQRYLSSFSAETTYRDISQKDQLFVFSSSTNNGNIKNANIVCRGEVASAIKQKAISGTFSEIPEYSFFKRVLRKTLPKIDIDKKIYKSSLDQMGIGKLIKDAGTTFMDNAKTAVLTTDFVSRYQIRLRQLLKEGVSISDIKMCAIGDTYEHLKKNLGLTPSDLKIDRNKFSIINLQELYGVNFSHLEQDFGLTIPDILLDLFFSVLDMNSLGLTLDTIVDKFSKIQNQSIYSCLPKILCYRWFLTNNTILEVLKWPQIKYIKSLLGHTDSWEDWVQFMDLKLESLDLSEEDISKLLLITGNKTFLQYLNNKIYSVPFIDSPTKNSILGNVHIVICIDMDPKYKSHETNSRVNERNLIEKEGDLSESDEDIDDESDTEFEQTPELTMSDMLQKYVSTSKTTTDSYLSPHSLISSRINPSSDRQARKEKRKKFSILKKKFKKIQDTVIFSRYEAMIHIVKSYTSMPIIATNVSHKETINKILEHMRHMASCLKNDFTCTKITINPILLQSEHTYELPLFDDFCDDIYYLLKSTLSIFPDEKSNNEYFKHNRGRTKQIKKILAPLENQFFKSGDNKKRCKYFFLDPISSKEVIQLANENNLKYNVIGLMPCALDIFGFKTKEITKPVVLTKNHRKTKHLTTDTQNTSKNKHSKKH